MGKHRPFPEAGNDPNGWLWQIRHNLRLSPQERLKAWTDFSNGSLRHNASRWEMPYVEFSPRNVAAAFARHNAHFVMVGMGAAYLRGVPYPTKNTDLMPDPDPENLARTRQALRYLNASPLNVGPRAPVEGPVLPGFTQLFTSAGMVNIVEQLPEVGDYPTVEQQSKVMNVGEGQSVRVASLNHVIASKRQLGRRLDPVHVLMCEETLAEQRRQRVAAGC